MKLNFTQKSRVRQRVSYSTTPELQDSAGVLVKLAVWPWEIPSMEKETAVHNCIGNSGIGPKFLGHVTEDEGGRVVGFATEWVDGARIAEPEDINNCRKALEKLHRFGIKHGDINKHSFMVRDGCDVVLVDFEFAERDCSPQELKKEMDALQSNLEDLSFRGGMEYLDE